MKISEFKRYLKLVESMKIVDRNDYFLVFVDAPKLVHDFNFEVSELYIYAARENIRRFKTIAAAYKLIRELGWTDDVVITCRDPETGMTYKEYLDYLSDDY